MSAALALHQGQPVLAAGEPLESARAAMILIHGRGAGVRDILGLAAGLGQAGFAYLAPQAARSTWYPNSFLAPLASNEPWLSSALAFVGEVLQRVTSSGVPPERTLFLGFSQGACLSLEFAARNPRRFGGLLGLSGGLIGPDGTPRDYAGSLQGTPVFLGCDAADPHVPAERVRESAEVLGRMGAEVDWRLYTGLGHAVSEEEMEIARSMMALIPDP